MDFYSLILSRGTNETNIIYKMQTYLHVSSQLGQTIGKKACEIIDGGTLLQNFLQTLTVLEGKLVNLACLAFYNMAGDAS